MNYKWNDTEDKITRLVNEDGIDRYKLEKSCELAAYKIYPVYKAYNEEIGDRVPTLRYLSQIIFELAVSQIADPDDSYSWAGIYLESIKTGEIQDDFYGINISYHIASIDYTEVQN